MLLLLLQHDADARRRLATALQDRGAMVETAATGSQAVNKAILIAPDAVLIDVHVPDAEEAATRLKRSLVTRRIPLLQLTDGAFDTEAMPPPEYETRVRSDCDPDELLSAIRRLRVMRRPAD